MPKGGVSRGLGRQFQGVLAKATKSSNHAMDVQRESGEIGCQSQISKNISIPLLVACLRRLLPSLKCVQGSLISNICGHPF